MTRPRTSSGELDLDRAPVTLEAIVNRLDVRDLSVGSGGEGRFVFGINGPGGFPLQATLIFEYNLPAKTYRGRELWSGTDRGTADGVKVTLPAHGCILLALTPP